MNKNHRSSVFHAFFALAILLCSCVTPPHETEILSQQLVPSSFEWEELSDSIFLADYEIPAQKVYYHLAKINLCAPSLSLAAFPGSENEIHGGYFKSPGLKRFLKESGSILAVNASPFTGVCRFPYALLSSKRANCGILKVNGKVLYPAVERYDAVIFNRGPERLEVSFVSQSDTEALKRAQWAFGGFWIMLSGRSTGSFADIHNGRTALALSEDKNTLFILCVEKRGRGLSYEECARILLEAGATDAIQMDGGPFAGLYASGKKLRKYGQTFRCGSCFGFTAK